MITLSAGGVWLLNGVELIEDNQEAAAVLKTKLGAVPAKEEAAKNTIAY